MHEIFVVKTDGVDEHTYNKLLALLPEQEKERKRSVNSLVGAFLVRFALNKVFGLPVNQIEILRQENGKPYLKDCDNIHFSISHSRHVVACIVSDKPIGIDIQEIKPVSECVIKRTCSENEIDEISNSSDPVSSFIYTWTKKEAVLKKKGSGILDKDIKNCLENEKTYSTKYENYWISCTI